jgi:lipoate-protein ligase A
MSIDEAIVAAVAAGQVSATLRFYGWSRPTLSLGYFQSVADASAWFDLPIDLVRRHSGGGAIMHDHELTYSLSLPLSETEPGARESVYRTVHQCIIDALHELNVIATSYRHFKPTVAALQNKPTGLRANKDEPFLCFQRRTDEDLICGGYKILGSAQRRVRGGVLQHGSLLLRTSSYADALPGINELSSLNISAHDVSRLIAKRISVAMSHEWQSGSLNDEEWMASDRIRAERYANALWTNRR